MRLWPKKDDERLQEVEKKRDDATQRLSELLESLQREVEKAVSK